MATALTYYTELQEPTVNGDVDLWGAILNATNAAWDRALAGEATASLAGGDWTPTTSDGECLVLTPTGVLGTNRNIIVPAKHRRYIVKNDTTGAFTVTIKTASGSGIVCTQGVLTYVYCNGTDCFLLGATGAYYPIGTSGATVPLNNGNNTSSGNVTYSGTSSFTGVATFSGGSGSPAIFQWSDDGATAGPAVNMTRVSTTPAANDLLGLWNFRGRDSGGNDTIYARVQAQIIDATDTSEDGALVFYTMQAGTLTAGMSQRLGLFMPGTTDQGVGTINATALYQGGVALGTAAFVNTGTSGATVPRLNAPSTFSGGTWVFDGSTTTASTVQLLYSDPGANAGPRLDLFRSSASPAATDLIGAVQFIGRDSGGNPTTYAVVGGAIVDPTDTSEDAEIYFQTFVAGTSAVRVRIGGGIYSQGVTGGDKGAGTANFATYYIANTAINSTTATTAIGTSGATIPLLNGNNTYSGTSAFTGAVTMSGGSGAPLTLTYVDAGSGAGPTLNLFRDSSTPAASDVIGVLSLHGRDSGGNDTEYASVYGVITDPTNGSEDATLFLGTVVAGSFAGRVGIGAGLYTATATGGDQGAGTVNATAYYRNGVVQKVTQQILTASGTYTPTTGAVYAIVELVGGGGGGGGADATSGSNSGVGGGGGGGGYSRKLISLSGTYSYTIGAAGTAGSNSGGNGGAGGTTSFGTGPLLQATGGSGGVGLQGSSSNGSSLGGNGGVGSSGDFNAAGSPGQPGHEIPFGYIVGGSGGSSLLGGGGNGAIRTSTGSSAGANAGNYGAGGGGAACMTTATGSAGGLGTAGVIIVTEFTL